MVASSGQEPSGPWRSSKYWAPRRAAALIGPEGDLTPEEYRAARSAGAVPVGFGTSVLRSDTAAFYALSALKFALTE